MLQNLPIEILALVIEKITDRADLKRLCEVSKILNNITIPYLYEEIVIEALYENQPQKLGVESLLRTCSKPFNYLSYAKKVRVLSRSHNTLYGYCIHRAAPGFRYTEEGNEAAVAFTELVTNLISVLQHLKDGSLQSFSWELGICIPSEILGRSGHLQNKQSFIESLSLITGGDCHYNTDTDWAIDLSAFRSLRSISWISLWAAKDFEALRVVLLSNSAHLKELRLDFVDWIDNPWNAARRGGSRSENFFARTVLKLSTGEAMVKFPALETLLLRAVSFKTAASEMLYAFNFSRLRSLTLLNCPDSMEFLSGAIELGLPIKLVSLEVLADPEYASENSEVISTFLGRFEGLENLYVSHPKPADTIAFWRSMFHHKSTLIRFAYHQRFIDTDMRSSGYQEEHDLLDLSLSDEDVADLRENPLHHPFRDLNLECIGLSCDPYYLKPILGPFITKRTLKILHVRRCGSDLAQERYLAREASREASNLRNTPDPDRYSILMRDIWDFANWAFGPGGFPVLEILAFGDFSYQGRYANDTALLCRDTSSGSLTDPSYTEPNTARTFRKLRKTDPALWDLLKRNADFLEACPIDNIRD